MLANKERKIIAIIPARAGSKGLPNKNILNCAGKPLIAWTIQSALRSAYISKTLITTDSLKIKQIAKQYGAWVPFMRDHSLSKDDSSMNDVIHDTLARCVDLGCKFDLIILLQPTSPLRTSQDIDEAIRLYLSKKSSKNDTLISVSKVEQKILWAQGIDRNGYLYSHFDFDLSNPRRQDLSCCYLPNGAIYISSAKEFNGFYRKKIIPYIMDDERSIDIDCHDDLEKASDMLKKLNK